MASFADLTDDMDVDLLASLNDGCADYFTDTGAVAAEGIEAIVDRDVERINGVSGFVDRVMTICVQKSALGRLDRKGAFRSNADRPVKALGARLWHIDDIAEDDGHLITFYLVP